jgi:hypothetical protein
LKLMADITGFGYTLNVVIRLGSDSKCMLF